ncbi:uncharacterized protein BO66DRAFT_353179 [Aspergillus aculeatinus CBS 121060]|uniref:Uncharacterized protein n=1 Tax=Aspergillus aculeatinus CBS 121060 TaxID=1448322 RepID=A0ACD1H440_9EURO|nr:hypothetical protein BO66DRAFT_353179 [Aspergillus aculeatinus CBS 121060]RAH68338.1 hypothetical protein BO66DRAFT_353179 [Aspergillus aculeatinus CBS 121060]
MVGQSKARPRHQQSIAKKGAGGKPFRLFENPNVEDNIFSGLENLRDEDLGNEGLWVDSSLLNGEIDLSATSAPFPLLTGTVGCSQLTDDQFTHLTTSEFTQSASQINLVPRSSPIMTPVDDYQGQRPVKAVSVPRPALRHLSHEETELCSHFFKVVIPLFCVWDNVINPMRTMIDSLWQHSAPLQHVIQSMSAACLSKSLPRMKAIASLEHRKAWACLKDCSNQSLAQDDRLISAWLIAHTYSWLHPQNLGLDIFDRIKSIVFNIDLREHNIETSFGFFQSAMIYSDMLLAFMRGRPVPPAPQVGLDSSYQDITEPSHPWLGISSETAQLVTEVGYVIYEQWRRQYSINGFLEDAEIDGFRACLKQARCIERQLLNYTPGQAIVSVTRESNTNPMDLQKTDEAYRYTGLLQLYRVFPDLLVERYTPWDKANFLSVGPPTSRPTRQEQNAWLANLALDILDKISTIPVESGARCLHPFVFVAVSGELRFESSSNAEETLMDTNQFRAFSTSDTKSAIEIAQARQFIRAKMSLYSEILPVPKIGHIFQLILKIWSAMDDKPGFIFWLDIVHRDNLHTLLG